MLSGDLKYNLNKIKGLLCNRLKLKEFCISAKHTGDDVSVQEWVEQMVSSFKND